MHQLLQTVPNRDRMREIVHTFETLGNTVQICLGELSLDAVFCLLNTVMLKALHVCSRTLTV